MVLPALALGGALGWSALAAAQGESCLRDSECAGLELCFEGACDASEASLASCAEGDVTACEPWELCVDEVCKRDDPVCRNALGECFFGQEQGECVCANAPGIEWIGDPPDVGSPSDDPSGQCFDVLAATCPAEVPEPVCATDEQRTVCEAFVGRENALNEVCNDAVIDDPVRIAGAIEFCCGEFDGVAEYRDCVLDLSPDDCGGFEACADGGQPGGSTSTGGSTPSEDPPDDEPSPGDDEPQEASLGCQVGGAGAGWLGALLLLGVGFRRQPRSQASASASSRKTA